MSTDQSTVSPVDSPVQLVCWKVWGGNHRAFQPVSIPGLSGVLHAQPMDSERGGDLYFLSACGSGAVARLCVADVTGHGAGVAEFSASLEKTFGSQIHRADPSAVLREVNRRTVTRNLDLVSTGVCLSYNSLNGRLSLAYAGHPYVMRCGADQNRWEAIRIEDSERPGIWDIPLGIDLDTRYQVGKTTLQPGDCVLVVTDGLTETPSPQGDLFGKALSRIPAKPKPEASADEIASYLLAQLDEHAGPNTRPHDDVTFVLLKVLPYQRRNRYSLLLRNNLDRFKQWRASKKRQAIPQET